MKKNILIYFPYNHRTVEQQSVMEMLVNKGHSVFLLTLTPENDLHKIVRQFGVKASSSPVKKTSGVRNIFLNAKYLVAFCKTNNIEIIIAHQQLAALPLIFARPFIKSKSFYLRHNADEDYKAFPIKAWIMNRFINKMLPFIIVPSDVVNHFMIEHEKVSSKKIIRINYGYNFLQYEKPEPQKVKEIKDAYSCKLLIISIARLVPAKRHQLMFEVVKKLINAGLDVKMICLGDGYLRNELQQWVNTNKLSNKIILKGNQGNVFDYFAAGDLLFHLSESEASNSVVKEAALVNKPVMVCERVGDFSNYIINGKNGFLLNKEAPSNEAVQLLKKFYYNNEILLHTGYELHKTVLREFDIKNVSLLYDEIIN